MADLIGYVIRVRGGRQGKAEADQVAEGFDNIASSALRAKLATSGSTGLADSINNVSGRMKLAVGAAALFGPALISVGASATAAAAGGAAVGGGGLTALATGLAGFGIIAKSATGDLKKVRTALDQYHMVVAQHGRYSLEAYRAERTLFAAVKQNGGRQVLQTARAIDALGKSWRRLTTSARRNVFGVVSDAIAGARRLLPTFARETNRNSFVIRQALGTAFRTLSGREMRSNLSFFSATFRRMAGPLTRGFTNLFIVVGRVLRAAAPYAVRVARSFERLTMSWRAGTRNGGKVRAVIADLVDHFKSWWGLIKAVGYVLGGLFTNSKEQGKGLVDSLTGVLNNFGAWMRTAEGQKKIHQFFTDSANAVREVARMLQRVAQVAFPLIDFMSRHLPLIIGLWAGWKGAMFGATAVSRILVLQNALKTAGWGGLGTSAGGRFGRAFGAAGGVAGRIFGAAAVTAIVLKLNDGSIRRTVESLLNPMSGTKDARSGIRNYKPKPGAAPYKRDPGPLRLQGHDRVSPTLDLPPSVKPLSSRPHQTIIVKVGDKQLAKILDSQIAEAKARGGG